jgi:N-acetylglucosaminyl-diphospho-decaprenol L-rhamnosyltransferase
MSDPSTTLCAPRHEFSVVVVTYNSAATIRACLRSIEAGGVPAEIVVLDNASTDDTVELVRREFPQVRLIASPSNAGFGRGCNQAWRETSAPYVLLLNPDAQLQPGAVLALLAFARATPDAGLIGPRLLNPNGTLQHSCFRFPNLRMVRTGLFFDLPIDSPQNGRYLEAEYERPHPVEHLLGACLLIRRAAIEQVGLLDEGFFMYFEETDLCYRMQAAGWQNWYTPSATAVHVGAHSTSRDPERMSAIFFQSQARFWRKHYPWQQQIALKGLTILGLCVWSARTLRGLLCRRIDAEKMRRRFASYWTIACA